MANFNIESQITKEEKAVKKLKADIASLQDQREKFIAKVDAQLAEKTKDLDAREKNLKKAKKLQKQMAAIFGADLEGDESDEKEEEPAKEESSEPEEEPESEEPAKEEPVEDEPEEKPATNSFNWFDRN